MHLWIKMPLFRFVALMLTTSPILCVSTTAYSSTAWPATDGKEWPTTWYWTTETSHQDLTGLMFSLTPASVVTIRGPQHYHYLYGLTVCLRIIRENGPGNIFSVTMGGSGVMSLGGSPYGVPGQFDLTVGQSSRSLSTTVTTVPSFGKLWPWTSMCVTWNSSTGMTQLWKDGSMSVRKGMWRGQSFYGSAAMTLSGLEGQVTDVHMWGRALSLSALRSYNKGWGFTAGDLLSWRSLSYSNSGYVVVEDAYESQGDVAEPPAEKRMQQQGKKRRWWKQADLNLLQEDVRGVSSCLGLRKRCGKKQKLRN